MTVDDKEATYATFRVWLGSSTASDDMWAPLIEEDSCFDYEVKGVGREVASEIEVYTESGDHDEENGSDIED